jgi:protein SCO1/2
MLNVRKGGGMMPLADIGGPFQLVDHRGKPVTERDYLGKPTLVFFGFTYCPDVCPTTLFELTNRLTELGPDADRLNVVFITVDPERDTPEQLKLYLSSFDPRITGLSGTEQNVAAAMKGYRAYARKVPLKDGGYNMDHTATIYLMNKKGQFVGHMNHQEPESTARAKLRRLLDDVSG